MKKQIPNSKECTDGQFLTTRWSLVRNASSEEEISAAKSLAEFCQDYRAPLLAFAKATAPDPQDAEDFIQGFFEKLLQRGFLANADPDRGRLRTFLLTCLKRHIADELRKKYAAKRGGGIPAGTLDEASGIASEAPGPDELYHRKWAILLLERTVELLRQSWAEAGKSELFDGLSPCLGYAEQTDDDRAALAARLGMTKGSLKTALYRLRRDYRDILLQEIASTLEDKTHDHLMDEMKDLFTFV